MRFEYPVWLWAGALAVAVLFVLRVVAERKTKRALAVLSGARLVDARDLPSPTRRWSRVALVCFATAMGFVALARPQKGTRWETLDRRGTDLLLVVDTSKSMNADDVRPSRLERTKLAVRDLVERFPGDRVGLVAFAGDATVQSPMTLDHAALLDTVQALDTSIVSRGGTDIGHAIDVGARTLEAETGNAKVMVLLTDGEDLQGDALDAARRARRAGIVVDTVGIGTPRGELVPATDARGRTVGVVRDEAGQPVRSKLDEGGLRAIAEATHGTYRPLGVDGGGLARLYAEALAPTAHVERGARLRRVYAERFAVPLALALMALVADALLGARWRRSRRPRIAGASQLGVATRTAAACVALLLPSAAHASVADAEKAYAAGHYDEAAKAYAAEQAHHPDDARIAVDRGTAAYKAGDFDAAEAAFGEALKKADPGVQQRALYDLGDTRYRVGQKTAASAPEKTIEVWKAAIAAYDGALALSPSDADARFNRDFVQRKLAELEKKRDEQRQSKDPQHGGGSKSQANASQASAGAGGQSDGKSGGGGQSDGKSGGGVQSEAQPGGDSKDGKSGGGLPSDPKAGDGQSEANAGRGASTDPNANDAKPNSETADRPAGTRGATADGRGADGHDGSAGNPGARASNGGVPGSHGGAGVAQPAASTRALGPEEARALLESLRGDERRGASVGTASGEPPAEGAPRKDW